jgi:hypothetical protein
MVISCDKAGEAFFDPLMMSIKTTPKRTRLPIIRIQLGNVFFDGFLLDALVFLFFLSMLNSYNPN